MKKTLAGAMALVFTFGFQAPAQANQLAQPCAGQVAPVRAYLVVDMVVQEDTAKYFKVELQNQSLGTKTFQVNPISGITQGPSKVFHAYENSNKVISRLQLPVFKCKLSKTDWRMQIDYPSIVNRQDLISAFDLEEHITGAKHHKYLLNHTDHPQSFVGVTQTFVKSQTTTNLSKSIKFTNGINTCLQPPKSLKEYFSDLSIAVAILTPAKGVDKILERAVGFLEGLSMLEKVTPAADGEQCNSLHPAIPASPNNSNLLTDFEFKIDNAGNISSPTELKFDFCTTNYSISGNPAKFLSSAVSSVRNTKISTCPANLKAVTKYLGMYSEVTGADRHFVYTYKAKVVSQKIH